MTVEIDRNSGFCGGVIRAIEGAEKLLAENGLLYSLGAIVHNEAELARLHQKGLITVYKENFKAETGAFPAEPFFCEDGNDAGAAPRILLIRAHGEPPQTYIQARELGFEVVDFTCPVVLNIQKSIREAAELNAPGGQIVIFGKIGHAEVLGLVGQVGGKAVVIENSLQLTDALSDGRIDTSLHIDIFSQTTKSPVEYEEICRMLAQKMASLNLLTVHNTICRQVASRHKELADFARTHDVVVFVSGRESSNGMVLSELCKKENPRTYCIVDASGLDASWFSSDDNVGVCGATSTPKWLLDEVASRIKNLH